MRNSLLQKINHHNNTILIELVSILFIGILFFLLDYFVCWQPTLNEFLQENHAVEQKQAALLKKQTQLFHEKKTLSELQTWKNNNPLFYADVSAISNVNQQLSLLTKLIQNAHFDILQMTKIKVLNNSKSNCTLTLTATGQFINLFSLITTLNHFTIPFTLSELSIHHHQFKMTFVLRGCHA